ncbi:MAG: glycoside hydrolase family 31 protein [Bacteroides sp.]|nr:glycoside hydrolase family 31 protein [Bacteroides sp.]
MKKVFLPLCLCIVTTSGMMADVNYRTTPQGVVAGPDGSRVAIEWYTPSIVRIYRYPSAEAPAKESLSVIASPEKVKYKVNNKGEELVLKSDRLTVTYNPATDRVSVAETATGRQLIAEKGGTSSFSPFKDHGRDTYQVSQTFILDDDEPVFGLGQHRHGHWSQRGTTQHLEQENMEIAIPIIQSPKGYALFWDNPSATDFTDDASGMTFASKTGDMIDYYVIYGGDADATVAQLRDLTGQAPMFPLWTYGFHQSRERYTSQDELVGTVEKYRSLGVPLDGIIQDWQYWGEDNHQWNAVEFLNPKFPDPAGMMRRIHDLNAHATISIWPSFGPNTSIYRAFEAEDKLMAHKTFPQNGDTRVYNPWDSRARDIYWGYFKRNMMSIGMDGWWLDATEPEHSPIEESDYDYETGMGTFRSLRNSFPLVSVGGIYDHQRAHSGDRRVFILTRSAYAGQQRYGAQSWSGDVEASWETLRRQIPAALNFSLCGIPYWNSDIGGFYTWRDYPDGIKDPAYQELYTRWMQFGGFTGMMRSHGTNCPREIWQFGTAGSPVYDAQAKAINLRYRFLPYIYSAAWDVTNEGASLMRPLYADYASDPRSVSIDNQYLFGKSVLVAPMVTSGVSRDVYLPEGNSWIDFWTGRTIPGGSDIKADAPLDIIPLYVKAGSILPMGPQVQYAAERPWDDMQIRVYPGADGEFTLYEDEGDNYNYEKGRYTTIPMKWDDRSRTLTIEGRNGEFDGMPADRTFRVVLVSPDAGTGMDIDSTTREVAYNGKKVKVKF